MRLAVIPARGGSKRIPRKNIRQFCGLPMLVWPLRAAIDSGCFDRIVVSTEDREIAAIARQHGADVCPRPAELADDHTGTVPVITHACAWQAAVGPAPEAICCIYATAPFVRSEDLRRGLQVLEQSQAEYAFSATTYAYPIQRALRVTDEGRIEMLQPEHLQTRSQDLEAAWHDAGQFYWGRFRAWSLKRSVFSPSSALVPLPRHRVQDIDTEEDWERAEWLFRALREADAGVTKS